MIEKSLRYPIEGESTVKLFLLAYAAMLLSIFVLPIFVLMGYFVKVAGTTARGESDIPPQFTDWKRLLTLGIKSFLLSMAYVLVPLAILVGALIGVDVSASGTTGAEFTGPRVLALFVGILVYLAITYVIPAAFTAMSETERLRDGFNLDKIKPLLLSGDYLVAMVVVFLFNIVVGILSQVLAFTIVGLLFLPPIAFYSSLFMYHIIGRVYNKKHGEGTLTTGEPEYTL